MDENNNKSVEEIIADAEEVLKGCRELDKELKYTDEQIKFLINEWHTHKRYFKLEGGRVTTEDVIKTVFEFAWASRANYEYLKNKGVEM